METATTPMQSKPLVDVTCKLGTKGCFKDGRCHYIGNCENKIETNEDRIRAMSDEELRDFLSQYKFCDICDEGCDGCIYNGDCDKRLMEWLKQQAEEGSDNG